MWTTLLNPKIFWNLHLDIIDFHNKFADNLILFKYIKKVKFLNNFFCVSGITAVLACIAFPVFDSIFLSKMKVLCFGFLIPFADPNENLGYFLTFVFQNIQVAILGCAYVTFITIYWQYSAHANVRIDILKNAVEDLNEHITDIDDEEKSKLLEVKLKEVVKLHNHYLRF